MDYNKENLEELFNCGVKILAELQAVSDSKLKELEEVNRRYNNLRENLQEVLNKCKD